jgi:DNA-binding response OmpR family regulator
MSMTDALPEAAREPNGVVSVGALEVDREGYRAWLAGRALTVTRSQVELLSILIENRHRVVSRAELSRELGLARPRSVDVLLSGLRHEIGRPFLRNVRNRGWIVEPAALA